MVTLSDLDAIGETYLYSTCSKKESKDLLIQYKKIVNKVISNFNVSVAEYLDWYRRSSYILIKSNNIDFSFPLQIPTWEQEPSSVENQHERSKFGEQIEITLKESQIQDYLQYYANILHDEFGFNEYPHYCIIVRPISVIEGRKEVIPLGNLYLHFATTFEKDEKFYMRLINDFLIVWFKRKGVKIIREIKFKTIQDQEKKKEEVKKYLPKFNKLHPEAKKRFSRKLYPVNKSLEDYYDFLFSKDELKDDYLKKLDLLREFLIPTFFALKIYLEDQTKVREPKFYDLSVKLGFNDNIFGIQGQSVLCTSFNIEHFIKTLIRREFFKIGFLVYEINYEILRNMLMDPYNINTNYKYKSAEADYTYLWTELFIPWKKISSKETPNSAKKAILDSTLRNRIFDSLSEVEVDFINNCKTAMDEFNSTSPNISLT